MMPSADQRKQELEDDELRRSLLKENLDRKTGRAMRSNPVIHQGTQAMDSLLELAARCETATGPDSELSIAVLLAVGWQRYSRNEFIRPDGMFVNSTHLPDPLASIDAAMTLVPEGLILRNYTVSRFVPHTCEVAVDYAHGGWVGHSDHSFAFALCAAALRAIAHQMRIKGND